MKRTISFVFLVGLLASLMAGTASATLITFEFDMPAFEYGTLAGENSVLRITVNSPTSSIINQTCEPLEDEEVYELVRDLFLPQEL